MEKVETAPGIFIHVETAGNAGKPTIVLAHSVGCELALWDRQIAALAQQFHVIRYDTRGHGKSSAPPAPYPGPSWWSCPGAGTCP